MPQSQIEFATDAHLAAGQWEPCADFTGTHADSPVCAGCGWLDQDHIRDAVVRPLRAPAPRSVRPRRLSS